MGILTREDIMNGWTEEKLMAYFKERNAQKAVFADLPKPNDAKSENTSKFNPHNW